MDYMNYTLSRVPNATLETSSAHTLAGRAFLPRVVRPAPSLE
jgi:hypothetical protein